jgi:hypothetical protein
LSVTCKSALKLARDEPAEFLESVGQWFDIVAKPKTSPLCGFESETSLLPEYATVTVASRFCFNGRAGKSTINGSIGSTSRKVWS